MDKLNVPWHSYKKNLPVDSALPFQIPIEENYDQVTTALALKHGWMWKIPTRERYGCGYVYDSEHITPEQAQQEVEELLGHEIAPIRNIKFDAGRGEKMWEKNCMSLGLATAFSEPLEATSIHTTVAQLVMFIFEYLQDTKESTVIESRIDQFNKQMITMYDEIKDFLVLHYQGGRNDTEFWKRIASGETMSDRAEWILDMCKHGAIPSINTFGKNYLGMIGPTLHNWTLAGLGHITPEHARAQLEKFNVATQAKYETEGLLGHLHHNIARILEMS
jgi:tryptophan halogenase